MKKSSLLLLLIIAFYQEVGLALPSFARQTQQPCSSCHVDFPQLTPFGRQFKLNGYTLGANNNTVKNLTDSILNSIKTPQDTSGNNTTSNTSNTSNKATPHNTTSAVAVPANTTASATTTNAATSKAVNASNSATNSVPNNAATKPSIAPSTPVAAATNTATPASTTNNVADSAVDKSTVNSPSSTTATTGAGTKTTNATSTHTETSNATPANITNKPNTSSSDPASSPDNVGTSPADPASPPDDIGTSPADPASPPDTASTSPADHGDTEKSLWFPPISIMGIEGFTHTQAPQDNTGTDLKPNDNFQFQTASIFYGGAITDHIGAFAQGTYNAPSFGPPPEFKYSWDNTDIRYANTATISKTNFIYGITVNNNPTVQDVWNTTPAWSFPFVSSNLAPTPSATPIINQDFAASVVGAGLYSYIDNIYYIEATGYQTLSASAQRTLGIDPTDTPGLFQNIAPYFRVAAEPNWGNNYLEIGTFGMYANVEPQPWNFPDIGTDSYFDIGFDSQYQYMGSEYVITLRNSIILENQNLNASFDNGLAANKSNNLNTLSAQASFAYGQNFRLPLTVDYFNTWGSEDELLYSDNGNYSPNSSGWITEIAYIPFGMDKAPLWPWLNARIGVQYIWYNEFNGVTAYNSSLDTKASDNNTIFAYVWLAM